MNNMNICREKCLPIVRNYLCMLNNKQQPNKIARTTVIGNKPSLDSFLHFYSTNKDM